MQSTDEVVSLERQFWQSMVDHDTDAALGLLADTALMVGTHGALKFDHAGYRKMADHGTMVLKSYALHDVDAVTPSEDVTILTYRVEQSVEARGKPGTVTQQMNDTSTWVRKDGRWQCVAHTETPVAPSPVTSTGAGSAQASTG